MKQRLTDFYQELDSLYQCQCGSVEQIAEFLKSRTLDPVVACSACNELGSLYRGAGRYAESMAAFEQAEKLAAAEAGTNSGAYATVLNNMAGTSRLMGAYEQAIELFQRSMDIYAAAGMGDGYPYASALNNLALVYLDMGEQSKAADYIRQSMELLEHLPGHQREIEIARKNLAFLQGGNDA